MVDRLFKLKDDIEANDSPYVFTFDFNIDSDGEIKFEYVFRLGWEIIFNEKLLFNACDIETNIAGYYRAISEIVSRIKSINLNF